MEHRFAIAVNPRLLPFLIISGTDLPPFGRRPGVTTVTPDDALAFVELRGIVLESAHGPVTNLAGIDPLFEVFDALDLSGRPPRLLLLSLCAGHEQQCT